MEKKWSFRKLQVDASVVQELNTRVSEPMSPNISLMTLAPSYSPSCTCKCMQIGKQVHLTTCMIWDQWVKWWNQIIITVTHNEKDMECRAPIIIIETLSPIASLLYCVILLLSRQDATAERLIGLEASCTIRSTRWKQQMNSQPDARRHVSSWMLRTQEVCQHH
jgi:hypothetical protein